MTVHQRIELGLMYSHTCNIACRHCGILSSPQNKEKMRFDDAARYIREAAEIPCIRKVNFTGGEPLLFQDEHAALLELCRASGLQTRIVTNGFWARTVDKGLAVLARMKGAGLTELNFSADKFHIELMEPEILRNALECARRLDFLRIVGYVHTERGDPLDALAAMYGIPREDLLDLRDLTARGEALSGWKHKILVHAAGLIGLGRAAEHPSELHYLPMSLFPSEGCHEVVGKPVIYPDGDLQACCCAGGKIEAFTVGNLRERPLAELIDEMLRRPHYRFINDFGPKELALAVTRARPERRRRPGYTSICEVCVRACEGLTAPEIDRIAEASAAEKMLDWLIAPATPRT